MTVNRYGDPTLDFSNPTAVRLLNKMLLVHHYELDSWDIPQNFLVPAIPSRADYVHRIADLLAEEVGGKVPQGAKIKGVDVGVGANCVYPIIGHQEYGWSFVGLEVDEGAVKVAEKLVTANPTLNNEIVIRHQKDPNQLFDGIIQADDYFDFSMCNPPFHASREEAEAGTRRKWKNLKKHGKKPTHRSFSGQSNELWYPGGEKAFLKNMIHQSARIKNQVYWFTTLISKKSNVDAVEQMLRHFGAEDGRIIDLAYGNKTARLAAWTFLQDKQRRVWRKIRWGMQ